MPSAGHTALLVGVTLAAVLGCAAAALPQPPGRADLREGVQPLKPASLPAANQAPAPAAGAGGVGIGHHINGSSYCTFGTMIVRFTPNADLTYMGIVIQNVMGAYHCNVSMTYTAGNATEPTTDTIQLHPDKTDVCFFDNGEYNPYGLGFTSYYHRILNFVVSGQYTLLPSWC